MKSLITTGLVSLIALFSVNTLQAQGDDCATAVNVPTLDGTACPTATPSVTSTLAGGGCEEGTLDTWFQFTAQGPTADITVSNNIGGWRPEFLIINGTPNGTCGGFFLDGCFDANGNYNSILGTQNALITGEVYWIVVSSHNNTTTGTITVCVDNPPPTLCTDDEDCLTASTFTLNAPGGGPACINDCNNGTSAGPDFPGNNCEDLPNPTVWYTFTTGAGVATIDISLLSGDLSNPEYTIFTTTDCLLYTIISCNEGAGGSATANGVTVSASTTYIIGVSDDTGDEGVFDLCITQHLDNSACNTTNSLSVTSTSLGSPLTGPFLPGESVNFCYTVTDYQQFNCNYIGAFVPTFGDCWDPASFGAAGVPNNITTSLAVNGIIQCNPGPPAQWCPCAGTPVGAWSWMPAGSATYNIAGYYPVGTPMPAGWYFLSSYDPATGNCAPDPVDPDNTFGDGQFPDCGVNTFDYSVCFTLIAGPVGNCATGATDCSVSMKTFADGEFGAWNSVGCTVDGLTVDPSALDCLLPVGLVNFDGRYDGENSVITWETVSEINTSHFIVKHSTTTGEFEEVGRVVAAGDSEEELHYSFIHEKPRPGLNYYNLIAVDNDGSEKNHGYVSVDAPFNYAYFDKASQRIMLAYKSDIEVYSMDGKLVASAKNSTYIEFNQVGVFIVRDNATGIVQKIMAH
ncbi:MAG: hypothetical protein ACI837_001897 [Crocinitomicaceae bacterium]|jgi:hypothetical protein